LSAVRRRLVLGVTIGMGGIALLAQSQSPSPPPSSGLPHLRKQGTATQLVVDGRPFLIRGGELGNSSA
jgi:hypothetical protein